MKSLSFIYHRVKDGKTKKSGVYLILGWPPSSHHYGYNVPGDNKAISTAAL